MFKSESELYFCSLSFVDDRPNVRFRRSVRGEI